MKTVTINEYPHNKLCENCSFKVPTTSAMEIIFDKNSTFCLAAADAETCELPALSLQIKNTVLKLPNIDFRGALRARRKQLANPNCNICKGYGETLNLSADKGTTPCPCTKPEPSGMST